MVGKGLELVSKVNNIPQRLTISHIDQSACISYFHLYEGNRTKVETQIYKMAERMPAYAIIKDVKKRWGKGRKTYIRSLSLKKLWGDMIAIPELQCSYIQVSRRRGQQLKDVSQLDGWSRDGSKDYITCLGLWE